jgi:carbon-monoxide dehydrogenase medium subunit
MRRLSNVRVRNVATVGGALAHGDPHMDLPPVLIALGASVTAVSPAGERSLKVEDLLTGYYETALERNELIAEVTIPAQGTRRAAYIKFTAGSAEDWPALGIAVSVEADRDTLRGVTVVASAATIKATRLAKAEAALAGARIDDKALAAAGEAGAQEADIISDVRGSAPYKRELIRVHVGRAVRQALAGNGAH